MRMRHILKNEIPHQDEEKIMHRLFGMKKKKDNKPEALQVKVINFIPSKTLHKYAKFLLTYKNLREKENQQYRLTKDQMTNILENVEFFKKAFRQEVQSFPNHKVRTERVGKAFSRLRAAFNQDEKENKKWATEYNELRKNYHALAFATDKGYEEHMEKEDKIRMLSLYSKVGSVHCQF